MSFFSDLFGGGSSYQDAANAKIAGLNTAYNTAAPLYEQGRNTVQQYYGNALTPYSDLLTSANKGATAYGDATGANGQEGYDRAVNNFHAGPGFNFALDTGLQAIDRGAASRGMVNSGNLLTAEQQYGTGLANQNYQQYVQNLQPYLGQQTTAASGVAGVNMGEGNTLNTSFGNQGNLAYNTQAGIGNAQAAADMASANASNSFLNGALNLGSKLLGFL